MKPPSVKLDEAARQLVLMGLALLSLDHPDWQDACHRVALQFGPDAGELYEGLRRFRREFREPPENAREESVVEAAQRLGVPLDVQASALDDGEDHGT